MSVYITLCFQPKFKHCMIINYISVYREIIIIYAYNDVIFSTKNVNLQLVLITHPYSVYSHPIYEK